MFTGRQLQNVPGSIVSSGNRAKNKQKATKRHTTPLPFNSKMFKYISNISQLVGTTQVMERRDNHAYRHEHES